MSRKHFDAAGAMVAALAARQRALGISDVMLGRAAGFSTPMPGKWRKGVALPSLRSAIAFADALGLDLILKERQ